MTDRGIIKWQPFNSCFNAKDIIKDIKSKKDREKFPILSEDQLATLERKIIESYNLKLFINLKYYYDGHINNVTGQINYIDIQLKKLYINNKSIYFKQILQIFFL